MSLKEDRKHPLAKVFDLLVLQELDIEMREVNQNRIRGKNKKRGGKKMRKIESNARKRHAKQLMGDAMK